LGLRVDRKHLLKTMALVIGMLNDGLSKKEIYQCFEPALDKNDKEYVEFIFEFSLENGWIIESEEGRYVLTPIGKEFVSSQLG
jgi:hypothetical protein